MANDGMIPDTGEQKVSKVLQEALKLQDILGADKTVQILQNLQHVNKFNVELKNTIVRTTLDYYRITFEYLKQDKDRKYEEHRINALSIISLMLKKYCKTKSKDIMVILDKKSKQNITYYLRRINSLNERNPADVEIINAIIAIEGKVNNFINNYPIASLEESSPVKTIKV